ncbi:acyl-CoA dehydrogenase [Dethiosulfatibacter aminovorans DSM 17477]|uniref:Acyl-CoA dehydrogenase n=1 Tax=Dethiosulfatibacter aminovorans DSM 17477 TaxID=1121476 RepID=A0A1M6EII4_9FIRM|nr:acyl-CoA dehydrogenase family protein [Dethiosulfatibacter aminovorans]SHI85261.1 acyl-CoA dehydrogenase [Dethiosulfatibacter aminovorans DSM 17477]
MEKVKNLLLNPSEYDVKHADEKTHDIMIKTMEFFEDKGLQSIREDNKLYIWQEDWIKFQKKNGIYSTMLTAKGYGDEDSRFDLSRICEMSEILSFYGAGYQYPYQVSLLGVGPVWMGDNEEQKNELAEQLREGHLFAFGMSEKTHGADLYANEATIRPTENGKYVANGNKYYIGNAHIAKKVATLGKNSETGEWTYWVVDSGHRHYNYVKDIETPALNQARVGEYEMIEYPITDRDILKVGDEAFADGLSTVNIGKFQLGFSSTGIGTHAFWEAITHANRRELYGMKVTDFPHIKAFLSESFVRLNAMKLYALRSLDYFRSMSDDDRRYLLFNPIQKMKVTTQGSDVVRLLMDVVCAKGYENENFLSDAYVTMDYIFRLEGTAHVNMALVLKFVKNYFFGNEKYEDIPVRNDASDDSNVFKQRMGGLSKVKFDDYRKAYEGVEITNVKKFAEQVELFKNMMAEAPVDQSLLKNMDYMLNIGEIFTMIVYAQLALEGAKLRNVDEELINQIFGYFIKDINKYALNQLNGQINTEKQEEYLREISMLKPEIDKARDEKFWKEYVQIHDGAYVMNGAVIGRE